ncbi:MAG: hypothetical protein K6F75_03545 [Butyrivibrio sp.]|nr:hypothetical protein [Butyrivibrio sp.]
MLFFLALKRLNLKRSAKKKLNIPDYKRPDRGSLVLIKDRYTRQLQELMTSYTNKKISKREGYQRLSLLIRGFVSDATGINVENYTKTEILNCGYKSLDSLMNEYYVPEFAEGERAQNRDFAASCNKTMKVIKSWR